MVLCVAGGGGFRDNQRRGTEEALPWNYGWGKGLNVEESQIGWTRKRKRSEDHSLLPYYMKVIPFAKADNSDPMIVAVLQKIF